MKFTVTRVSDSYKDNARITWDPDNTFLGTARYYARYRPGYPDEVIQLLKTKFRLNGKSRALDLGCGTGQVALALAPHVAKVVAVDPMEAMLTAGKELAATGQITNIEWLRGQSGELQHLASEIGEIDITVMARSFHWMDRTQTLKDLYRITRPGGGLAVIADNGPSDLPGPPWKELIRETVKQWIGEERKAGTTGKYTHPGKYHQEILSDSDFRNLELAGIQTERAWSIDAIIGYLYSTSYTSIPVLGDKKEPFEADLREKLSALEPSGQFHEQTNVNVIMVWKPE
jgi:ubiquinone/menaquinone biosynthesis C-methylase UbiE